jgi:hypothetical protein
MTDIYQPLDLREFGRLKASTRAEHRKFVAAHAGEKAKTIDAVGMLLDAWDCPVTCTVEDA